jgi:hypothetical protein
LKGKERSKRNQREHCRVRDMTDIDTAAWTDQNIGSYLSVIEVVSSVFRYVLRLMMERRVIGYSNSAIELETYRQESGAER